MPPIAYISLFSTSLTYSILSPLLEQLSSNMEIKAKFHGKHVDRVLERKIKRILSLLSLYYKHNHNTHQIGAISTNRSSMTQFSWWGTVCGSRRCIKTFSASTSWGAGLTYCVFPQMFFVLPLFLPCCKEKVILVGFESSAWDL